MNATTLISGTTSEVLAVLSALEGHDVELSIELPARQQITSDREDQTVITYKERSEVFTGLLWYTEASGSCVYFRVGTRSVFLRCTNPICAPDRFTVRPLCG